MIFLSDIVVDDILLWGPDDDDHEAKLKVVMDRCRQVNLRLNKKKCRFRVSSVSLVGHLLTEKGMCPDPDKVKAIEDMPWPQDVESLQCFLGMLNYLLKFIKGHSQLTAPLRELMHQDVEFD